MDHDAVLDALESAAVEPDGIDRLMAGDTATAAAVAGHLAGCPSCTAELERLRRVSAVVRDVIVTTPAPDLRGRTLAYVRAHGAPRGAMAPAAAPVVDLPGSVPATATAAGSSVASPVARRGRTVLGWVAAVAAAVVISVVATSLLVGARFDERLAAQDSAIEDLATVTAATLEISGQPDATRVALASPEGAPTRGTLLFSPSTTELVVVASELTPPIGPGEYRCWVVVDGARQDIGKMFYGGGLAYWVGPSPAVAGLDGGATFGVSLVGEDGTAEADPVLIGES